MKLYYFFVSAFQSLSQGVLKLLEIFTLSLLKNSYLILKIADVELELLFEHGQLAFQFSIAGAMT